MYTEIQIEAQISFSIKGLLVSIMFGALSTTATASLVYAGMPATASQTDTKSLSWLSNSLSGFGGLHKGRHEVAGLAELLNLHM